MTARGYLFVSKATVRWCLARYLATDHPENMRAWQDLYPFAAGGPDRRDGDYANAVNNRTDIARYLASDPDPFLPNNSTFIDVSEWWGMAGTAAAIEARKAASMSPQAMAFMKSLTAESNVTQWAHVMDPELATQWLKRAMKLTPSQIGELEGQQQFDAIAEMWAAFGQYWKAMNIAPQGWARYRSTWEYHARPANTQIVLRDGTGLCWPRPSSAPLWPRQPPGADPTWYPENAPKYLGPWRWEAILANEQWGQARTGHTRLDANLTVLFGSIATYKERVSDNGTSYWGAPVPYQAAGGDSRMWSCQDLVVYGGLATPTQNLGKCFAPMNEVHAFWIDNAGMMSGGMNPVWMGVTEAGAPGNLSIPDIHWTNNDNVQRMTGADDVASFSGLGAELRSPAQLKTPGAPPRRRPRYLWGVTRCAASLPDIESRTASSFYAKFDMNGSRFADWSRTNDGQTDSIAVKSGDDGEPLSAEPRTSGPQTWRDGVLASIPPSGWGKDYVGWPVTGATWSTLNQVSTGSYSGSQWSKSTPYNIIGYSGFRAPYEGAMDWPLVLWQPPPKRYVDLLWPLLMYLDSKSPQEIACEVKYDVMGKNGFSLRALGTVLDAGTQVSLMDNADGKFKKNMQDARAAAQLAADEAHASDMKIVKLVTTIVQTVAVAVVTAVATPAAGLAVAAGFSLLNGAIALLDEANRSTVWTLNGRDVFGRPDGAPSRTNAQMILGSYERYALYNISSVDQGVVSAVKTDMYTSMRRWYRVGGSASKDTDYRPFNPGFVEDAGPDELHRKDPYPVGYPAPTFFYVGVTLTPDMLVSMANAGTIQPPVRIRNLKPKPKKVASDGINPATLAAAAVAGLAVGALISEVASD